MASRSAGVAPRLVGNLAADYHRVITHSRRTLCPTKGATLMASPLRIRARNSAKVSQFHSTPSSKALTGISSEVCLLKPIVRHLQGFHDPSPRLADQIVHLLCLATPHQLTASLLVQSNLTNTAVLIRQSHFQFCRAIMSSRDSGTLDLRLHVWCPARSHWAVLQK